MRNGNIEEIYTREKEKHTQKIWKINQKKFLI